MTLPAGLKTGTPCLYTHEFPSAMIPSGNYQTETFPVRSSSLNTSRRTYHIVQAFTLKRSNPSTNKVFPDIIHDSTVWTKVTSTIHKTELLVDHLMLRLTEPRVTTWQYFSSIMSSIPRVRVTQWLQHISDFPQTDSVPFFWIPWQGSFDYSGMSKTLLTYLPLLSLVC